MQKKEFTIRNRIKSFRYAFVGLWTLLKTQHSAWCHVGLTAAVIVVGLYLDLSQPEWCWLVLAIAAVWTAEAFNTSIEFLSDVVSPDYHPLIKNAKDVAAAGVLITVIGSIAIGILTFGPHVLRLLGH
ncbi:MAG: diacylglycerol kinase family protein [Kiritimatiellae bacterium]|jgi:diacylglycerol kinase (ATP)|nr:diacylglycerol kinase family protein [Kiritimatiellia bacterium]